MTRRFFISICFITGMLLQASASEPDFSAELPATPATPPNDALKSFAVQPPFRMELAAAEPLIIDPVAMAFDADGNLYVVEMRDYSEQEQDHLGLVRRLVDTNGDGQFDEASIFAKDLSWPTAITCWKGGVFVGAPPHLYYLKDTDNDGVADERTLAYTGFSRGNVQGMMNSLRWGLDNRIHGAGSSSGGAITPGDKTDTKPLNLGRRDFAFDPHSQTIEATTASAQHGLSFDDWGHKFICSNSDHIQQVMFEDDLIARNPYLRAPGGAVSIAAEGPQAEVFRTSPVEPWRIVRTRLRVQGLAPGPIEHGGKVSGYFSSATGVQIYRGDAWPKEWRGTAIIGDVGSNLIHRKKLDTKQLPFVASRIDPNSEFVTSTDTWFRPVQFDNGPDGALYVADFYRETIEHPKSIPESIKKHLDLTSRNRGRLWRIATGDQPLRPAPKLSQATTAELVSLLSHPNAWHRETASRLLYERQDKSAVPLLLELAANSPADEDQAELAALGRLHALYSLDGLNSLTPQTLEAALADPHPHVRENALKLARPRLRDSQPLRSKLVSLANDDEIWVRYQLAFTLGEIVLWDAASPEESSQAINLLSQLLFQDGENRWMRIAALSSLTGHEAKVLIAAPSDAPSAALADLASIVARRGKSQELNLVADFIEKNLDSEIAKTTLKALFAAPTPAIRNVLDSPKRPNLRQEVANRLSSATKIASDLNATPSAKLASIGTLRLAPFEVVSEAFDSLVDGRQPPEVQRAAVELLSEYTDPGVALKLVNVWPRLSPSVRESAAEALTETATQAGRLLDAIAAQEFDASTLPPAKRQLLREHPDATIRTRAETLLADTALAKRDDVVANYRTALELPGDPSRGKALFSKHCATCHKAGAEGYDVGPNLTAINSRGPEFILLNVLDPSREVNPQFVDYTLITTDGVVKTGLIASESPTAVTLKRAENATETILRLDIEALQSTGRSLMPDGLEKQLDQQALADIIAYLMQLE